MKTYLVFKDHENREIDSSISHYKTLAGLKRYGRSWLKVKNAIKVEVYSFTNSSQLYSGNMNFLGSIAI